MTEEKDLKEAISIAQIQKMVYVVRRKQVMLDSDLAMLYQVETKNLNKSMKRNQNRFPEEFCFQLTEDEYESLRFQFGTSNDGLVNRGGRRYNPYVFTEQGIAMLSAVLHSDIAIDISIQIMETFVEMRKYMANNSLLYNRLNTIEEKQVIFQNETNQKFEKVFEYISEHEEVEQKIFFEGQIYDAFRLLIHLVSGAATSIALIDNYVDIETLNILSKKKEGVTITIYTVQKTKLNEKDIKIFNQQYPLLEVFYTTAFHDRFMIIDNKKVYHIGASIKDAEKKCFAISLMQDENVITNLLQRLNPIC